MNSPAPLLLERPFEILFCIIPAFPRENSLQLHLTARRLAAFPSSLHYLIPHSPAGISFIPSLSFAWGLPLGKSLPSQSIYSNGKQRE